MTGNPLHSIPVLLPAGNLTEPLPPRSGGRKKASTACSACRARRSKCTGSVPCLACLSHGTECIKDENEDGRRRIAIKRKLEGLEEDRQVLINLIAALKNGSDLQVNAIVHQLRKNTSHTDLSSFLDKILANQLDSRLQATETTWGGGESLRSFTGERRPRTGGISDLINPPIQVPAKPWTNVTDDDELVSHLISLWFTWIHPWFRWVEDSIFIEAMQSKDLQSPLCAPYLVNIILAQACLLDASELREDSYHNRLREGFLMEAKKGLDAEQGVVSLTMVQAFGVQWTDLHLHGQDRQGRIIQNTQLFLAKDLDKWRHRLDGHFEASPRMLEQVDQSLNHLEWVQYGLHAFNLADFYSFHSLLQCKTQKPHFSHEQGPKYMWSAYPLNRSSQIEFHPDCLFESFLYLARISVENEEASARRMQGRSQDSSEVHNLLQQLWEWPNQLLPCMRLSAHATPHVLVLHTLYNWVILVLAKQAASADAKQPREPVLTSTPISQDSPQWQHLAIERAQKIAELMQTYTRRWGPDYFPAMVLQPISVALFALLEDLETAENKTAFISLIKTLRGVSRKYRVAIGVRRIVMKTARENELMLPLETEISVGSYDVRMSDQESSSEDSSRKVEDAAVDEQITVDYLLEKWNDLHLDDDQID